MDYFLARYYSSAQGRFTSVDPENAGASADDAQSWNGYAYARNNPLAYIDPTGLAYDFYVNGKWYRVNDATEFEKYGYTVYGGNDDGTELYIQDKDGNRYTAVFTDVPVDNPFNVQAQYNISPLADGVGLELARRQKAFNTFVGIVGAINLAPAAIASATLSGGTITTLGIAKGPSVLTMMGAKDAAVVSLAIEKGASATGNFMTNVTHLSEALSKVIPGAKVNLLGHLNGSPIFGSLRTGIGIVERNGVTYVVKALRGQSVKILGKLEK